MKLSDFPFFSPKVFSVTIASATSSAHNWKPNAEVSLWSDATGIWMRQEQAVVEVTSTSPDLEVMLARKELPWLLVSHKGQQVYLQCAEPADWLPLGHRLELSVDERIAEQLSRAGEIAAADVSRAVDWCMNTFVLEGSPRRVAAARFESDLPGDWQIIGIGWRADLQRRTNGSVLVNRVARVSQAVDSWTLIQGEIHFVDASVASQLMSEAQQAALAQAIKSNGDYVELWRKYSEKEWERSLRKAGQLGALHYTKCEEASQEGGAWRFFVSPDAYDKFQAAWRQLESDVALALEAGESLPAWQEARYLDLTGPRTEARFYGRPRFDRQSIVIESERSSPPDEGYLYLSLAGDKKVQERRQRALQNINSEPRSLKLRYILKGVNVPAPRLSTYEVLSQAARDCFKNGNPTGAQTKAIKAALETPDICLIIGPPGTGKTQVIAALSRRFAELGGDSGVQHQVLITSFQHDAVENALERAKFYGLPPVKVGAKGRTEEDQLQHWCQRQYGEIDAIVETESAREAHVALLRRVHQLAATLRHGQVDAVERRTLLATLDDVLDELESTYRLRLPTLLKVAWKEFLAELPSVGHDGNTSKVNALWATAIKKVRALRVTPLGFDDDGPERAADAQLALARLPGPVVFSADLAYLAELAQTQHLDDSGSAEVSSWRDRLLDALIPDYRPPEVRNRIDAEGLKLVNAIEAELGEKLKGSRLGISSVLTRYRDAFINHPVRVRDTVREYAMVVGATCQQSASAAMANLKSISGLGDAGITFDNVIIDEAARANPLDLFIPMSMAKRRVILVGDHRQLPHLLEPEVEDELAEANELNAQQRQAFADSLFERLWRQLKDREAIDGFPRVVMLDRQFRMHPLLGEFVSREFYEKEHLPPLKPGRNADEFMDKIPGYEGKVCAWLDVPLGQGEEGKRGHSRIRTAEAKQIAKEVKRLLEQCAAEVSIGVITFYSAQRDVIFEELSALEVTERDPETGDWQVVREWSVTPDGSEKLRVGTVDAFQGKEFDIVLLSNVCANRHQIPALKQGDTEYERAANRKFGHLRLSNRMNVAMSRQRSLLVVIGDKAMATDEHATALVPALVKFLELCEGEHGAVL